MSFNMFCKYDDVTSHNGENVEQFMNNYKMFIQLITKLTAIISLNMYV